MTLEDAKKSSKEFLTPKEIAPIMRVHPYSINLAVKSNPASLGFPVSVVGTRVKIPRLAFIAFCEGKR